MSHYYVACDLGMDCVRVMLGTLHRGELTLSEVRRFEHVPLQDGNSLEWNIPYIYEELVQSLRPLGEYDEPVEAISCHSWGGGYLLFKSDGTLVTPARHPNDPHFALGMKKVLARASREQIYSETGAEPVGGNALFELGAEKSLRFGRARYLMPVADGFNFLLSNVPRIESSQASVTQLFNPVTKQWSERLLKTAGVSAKLLPPVVPAGTELGPVRPELVEVTNLREAKVFASCSHDRAAAMTGLPLDQGENWAYLWPGSTTLIGAQIAKPFIHDGSREMNFSNELVYGDNVFFYKRTVGLSILDECRRFWKEKDREMDDDLLTHLAASSPPFEAFINPSDPRFQTPGDMPLKIQAYCKETHQEVPWKPGPVIRCVLESLALLYRKALAELDYLTGRTTTRLCFHSPAQNNILLKSFIANALQLPTLVASPHAAALGNIIVQGVAMGHIKSLEEGQELIKRSTKAETLMPHATVWNTAYQRFVELAVA
jgi:rhamnulokinase